MNRIANISASEREILFDLGKECFETVILPPNSKSLLLFSRGEDYGYYAIGLVLG